MVTSNIKLKVQNFGRFLSNMVMPNLSAFIAWGLLSALFIPTGWCPNETLARLVGPMITYLLPLLIGYTGGRLVGGERGGTVGAITTIGVIAGADIPMFMGAMIAGPLGGFAIRHFDRRVEGKVKSGFEMLLNNFSSGIIGMLLAILAYLAIGPLIAEISKVLAAGVNVIVTYNLLPLTSIVVEPAKILFLNNAINHGIFSPLGIHQATETGASIFFLIEANPGPGLGVLLAYMFFGRGNAQHTASGAAIIHFLGGIHEIYFPYVLMNPRLLIALILGGMTGVFVMGVFHAGLISPTSPGSIFAVLLMTPKSSLIGVVLSVCSATLVSFLVSVILLKRTRIGDEDTLSHTTQRVRGMKAPNLANKQKEAVLADNHNKNLSHVKKIVVACDAGMGSSAMGAGLLAKKVHDAGLADISVTNMAINDLKDDVDIVVTHRDLTDRAKIFAPGAIHISLAHFLNSQAYSDLVTLLMAEKHPNAANDGRMAHQFIAAANDEYYDPENQEESLFTLNENHIYLNLTAQTKEEAIRFAGNKMVESGYVEPDYVDAMLAREKLTSTYLGESIAVPHGTIDAKDQVLKTGIVICQYPAGVQFGEEPDEIACLVIGIAARSNEHIEVIAHITRTLDEDGVIERLSKTQSVQEALEILSGKVQFKQRG
ncbi:PTS mannitol transporter subunit IICBA [Photorhabdus luminescens]|uniref:PTS system mannitol-specific EIICBA component n=1 Tax=Photorhabdus luminescens subsp. sonorensis TaxID=1173677 RepID=A0A5C4RKQ6_PHOLU|nr:PTS mannitol transporter subunit IICBA [Photorhabdus luminescens]TNH44542.1 PTS mannitol transporter subunit IICBA [Photorhabdus luminescens subsp. sonorensis]